MRIFFLIHSLAMGGAERVTATLANYWAEAGHSITIATMMPQSQDFYTLHPTVKRVALKLALDSTNPIQAFVNNARRIVALRRILLAEKPDIALGMMTTSNILLALAARGTAIPVIGSERTHPPMLPLGRLWEKMRREIYGFLQAVVALTSQSANWLREYTKAKRVEVIPNPVTYPLAVHKPHISPETIVPNGLKMLLSVGRLSVEKGFDRSINAFARVASRFPQWVLAIVGDGPELTSLQKEVARFGLNSRVFFPGRVGNLHHWYQRADLYVLTSRFEGFPNALVEAMAYGLPVVSVDCDTGPRDIIRHGIDGLLVPQGDIGALAEAMAHLMANAHARQMLGERATEVRERFSLSKIAHMWENLFGEVKREIGTE